MILHIVLRKTQRSYDRTLFLSVQVRELRTITLFGAEINYYFHHPHHLLEKKDPRLTDAANGLRGRSLFRSHTSSCRWLENKEKLENIDI